MSADRKEIDLIIKAAVQGGKTLESVVKNISDIEKALDSQTAAAKRGESSIEDLKATLLTLRTARDQLKEQAGNISGFEKLTAQITESVTKVAESSKAFADYKAKLDKAGEATEYQSTKLIRLANASERHQKTLDKQRADLAELTVTLQKAGVETDKLAAADERVRQSASQLAVSFGKVNSAIASYSTDMRKAGDAVKKTADAHELFSNSGRTTLSLMQRFRGEILSMVASYAGLYGAIQGAKNAITAYSEKQSILNQLSIATGGDRAKAAEEYAYVAQQAERLGISLEEAAKGYAKFSASATFAGRSAQENRYVFESVAEVGRVAGLTKDQLSRVFYAISQIDSKGKVMAEEFNQQLGESLPGLTGVAKKATEGMFTDFNAAMKEGKVDLNVFVEILGKYRSMVSGQLPTAISSLQSNQERLNNEVLKFKLMIAEGGFADEFGKVIARLTAFFKSDDGPKFAQSLSDALVGLMKAFVWCIENAETLKTVLYTALAVVGAKAAVGLAANIVGLTKSVVALNFAFDATTTAVMAMKGAFLILGAAFIGWQFGKILSEQFVSVRLAGVSLVIGLNVVWAHIKFGAKALWEEVPAVFLDGMASITNILTTGVRDILGIFSSAARSVGKTEFADAIDKVVTTITFKTGRAGVAAKTLKAELNKEVADIMAIGRSMWNDQLNPPKASSTTSTATAGVTPKPPPGTSGTGVADEQASAKRLDTKRQLENELAALSAKIDRREKEDLASRLRAIDTSYVALAKKIAAFGGTDGAAMQKQLTADVNALKLQETRNFNEALLKEQTELQRKLEQVDAQGGRTNKTDLDNRLAAIKLAYEQTYRDIEEYRLKLFNNNRDTAPADAAKSRLDAGIVSLQNAERLKVQEESLNQLLDERKAKLDVIAVQEKTGLMTAIQAREAASLVITDTQPKLEALVTTALEYVDAMREAAVASGESTIALDALKAKLIEGRESAKGLKTELLSAAQVNEMLASGATTAFQSMGSAIWDIVSGVKSWKDGLASVGQAFAKFAADFLMQISQMILKQALLNALQSATAGSTGGLGGIMSSAVGTLLGGAKHTGGVVNSSGTRRMMPAEWFANAPRYHGGGIAGLAPDEYPTVLKRNEEVLTADSPRNILNGGAQGGSAAQQGIKVINMIDSGSVVSEGLSTQAGEKAFFNFIRANKTGLKQVLA